MRIMCPQCNAIYNLPSERMPTTRAVATCRRCGGKIMVEPALSSPSEPMAASTRPPVQYTTPSTAPEVREYRRRAIFVDYPELQGLSPEKFDFAEILSPNNGGGYKSRKNKFKIKVLKGVHGILDRMLKDGERVMKIGKGVAYYPVELLLGSGWLTIIYNYYALVGTNQRLIFINIHRRKNYPTHYLFQMIYEEIKKVKQGILFSKLILSRVKGKRRIFTSVKRYIAKELKQFITNQKGSVRVVESRKAYLENLCPSCFVPLEKGLLSCPMCRATFKEPKGAFLRSLLLPGLGDIYLGHRFLGILELTGSLIVWSFVISLLLSGEEGALIMAVFLLLFYNLFDGLLTLHMGKKGYMLARR